jgi:large subunit ribosomal protein L24e
MKATLSCSFSGYKIHPGHGVRFVRSDSKSFDLLRGKSVKLFLAKKNPRIISWTQHYRKMHKKGKSEEIQKKRSRRVVKAERAIAGTTLEAIRAKRNQKPEVRLAAREAALKELKERKKAAAVKKEAPKGATPKAAAPKAGATKAATPKAGAAKAQAKPKADKTKPPKPAPAAKPAGKGR